MTITASHILKTGSLLLVALAAATLPAFAGNPTVTTSSKDKNPPLIAPKTEPRFYVDLLAGGEFDTGVTDFIGNGGATYIVEQSTLVPIPVVLAARPHFVQITPLAAYIQARDFNETHDAAVVNGKLELGYKVLPYLSVIVGFTYSHADGNERANVGTVDDTFGALGTAGRRFDLYADVGRYQAFTGRAGFKISTPRTILDLLHLPRAIRPYASFSAGGKYLDSQSIRFYTDQPAILGTGGRVKLYDDSWVFSVEGSLGYDLQLTRNLDIILENGYGYDTRPDGGDLRGVSGANNKGSRVYSTVSLGAKLKF